MKKKNIIFSVILALSLLLQTVPALAYELPHAYWSMNDAYGAAVEAQDYAGTIKYGSQIIDLISKEPSNDQTANIMGSRSYEVAFAYFLSGDYVNAAKYFNIYLPYGKQFGWDDGVIIAENCVKQFTSTMDVYQQVDAPQKTYGVKNEPKGVLYGQVSEKTQPNDSMVLLYLEYGQTASFAWANKVLNDAESAGRTVELALNFPSEGSNARNISASDAYLSELMNLLQEHNRVPIFIRIGAEFNIWSDKCAPNEFISAFKAIANRVRNLPNVSTVWSMAHTSTWKSAAWPYTASDFYPGDDVVDWVGVNCYPTKYFQAKTWEGKSKFNEVCFKTGYSSDPVLMVKEAIDAFGGRKPIMIVECGSAHTTNGSINKSYGDWGADYLKRMYSFIPIVYPQVKMIAYFNTRVPNELNYYDLDGSAELKSAYEEVVKSPWFVQGKSTNSAEAFFKKADGTITTEKSVTLYTYPHLYGSDTVNVEYYLDGKWVTTTNKIPYKVNLENVLGSHTLKVVATNGNGVSMTKEYKITGTKKPEKADDFSDTANLSQIQKSAIDYAVKNGIMTGYENNTIAPDNTITRAEFATMVCRAMGYDANENCAFDDAKEHWSSKYINACVKKGAINGVGNNKFAPADNITLEQAVKILTVVYDFAKSDAKYPDGFMDAAKENNLLQNLTSTTLGAAMKRIDVAMIMYNAANR